MVSTVVGFLWEKATKGTGFCDVQRDLPFLLLQCVFPSFLAYQCGSDFALSLLMLKGHQLLNDNPVNKQAVDRGAFLMMNPNKEIQ